MSPWICPRCETVNAPTTSQCTCRPVATVKPQEPGLGELLRKYVPLPYVPSPTVAPQTWPQHPWIGPTATFSACHGALAGGTISGIPHGLHNTTACATH